jgi:hypothetical protein
MIINFVTNKDNFLKFCDEIKDKLSPKPPSESSNELSKALFNNIVISALR